MPKRRSSSYWEDDWYESSRPREVADGIKAKNQRGGFASSWWAKRWIEVLEGFGWGNRLQRGRSYARKGQVASMTIGTGQVKAKVQGSRATPYNVTLKIKPLADPQWERVIDAMGERAIFAAKLLAEEMPQNIEEAFHAADVVLLPQNSQDIVANCSCPDFANPCKHIAAVYYLLGERFDDDPFLIFQLRGRSREQVLESLRSRRAALNESAEPATGLAAEPAPALSDLLDKYYQAGAELAEIQINVAAPSVEASVLKRLGTAPADSDPALRRVYHETTRHILGRLFGDD